MRSPGVILSSVFGGYAVYVAGVWVAFGSLALPQRSRMIAIVALALLGVVLAAIIIWYLWPKRVVVASPANADIEELFALANRELPRQSGVRRSSVRTQPVVIVLGGANTAKTTFVLRSPVSATQLAGEIINPGSAAPLETRVGNIWKVDQALIVEAGTPVVDDKARWKAFITRLAPRRGLRTIVKGRQAPRVAIVCVSCGDLVQLRTNQAGAAAATKLRDALFALATEIGSPLPVYVVFTKADMVRGFKAAAGLLEGKEITELVGTKLPIGLHEPLGTYVDRETGRLNELFTQFYEYFLGDRMRVLSRDTKLRADAFEFGRAFGRTLCEPAVGFLVELCRPDPNKASPFLRGFFLTGLPPAGNIDPSTVDDLASDIVVAHDSNATGALSRAGMVARRSSQSGPRVAGVMPQWVFIDRIMRTILDDEIAFGLTIQGKRIDFGRRVLLVGAAAVALAWCVAMTVSFRANWNIERRVSNAITAVGPLTVGTGGIPGFGTLSRIDTLRSTLEELGAQTGGAFRPPLHRRWGLYIGDALIMPAARAYFSVFRRLLLTPAHASLVRDLDSLSRLSPIPALYRPSFDALRTYLVITEHPEGSDSSTGKTLMHSWRGARPLGLAYSALADAQFRYYASVLPHFHPSWMSPDQVVIQNARTFLHQFGDSRIYGLILEQVKSSTASFAFNDPLHVVSVRHVVPGAFTAAGWVQVQREILNIGKYAMHEDWVTRTRSLTKAEKDSLALAVRRQYVADYVNEWRAFVGDIRLDIGGTLREISDRVQPLVLNQSPLLNVLADISRQTNVDTSVSNRFQPVHALVPPSAGPLLVGPANQAYIAALTAMSAAARNASDTRDGSDAAFGEAQSKANQVESVVTELAQKFPADPVGNIDRIVINLLRTPASEVLGVVRQSGNIADRAAAFCQGFRSFAERYPFDSTGADISIEEFSRMFRPNGRLNQFLRTQFADAVSLQGGVYYKRPQARVSDGYMTFINNLVRISNTFFAHGGPDPSFSFVVAGQFDGPANVLTLSLDNESFQWSRASDIARTVTWRGVNARSARLEARYGTGEIEQSQEGSPVGGLASPWALLRLFEKSQRVTQGGVDLYKWAVAAVRIEPGPGQPVLSRRLFSRLDCSTD